MICPLLRVIVQNICQIWKMSKVDVFANKKTTKPTIRYKLKQYRSATMPSDDYWRIDEN
jgi:hypothetical protein